jgi:uncharacterized protein YegP (UPF0339 family)
VLKLRPLRRHRREANYVPEYTPKFIIFRGVASGDYRWRLRSTSETLAASASGYPEKGACEQEVRHLKASQYPDAEVLDLSVRRSD